MRRLPPRAAAVLLPTLLLLPAPAPATAASGRLTIRALSGLSDGGRTYVMERQRVVVRGRVRPFAPGQYASVRVSRRGRTVARVRAPIRRVRRAGQFTVHFTARRTGTYVVRAHRRATGERPRLAARRLAVRVLRPRAGPGSSGLKVRLLERGLARLGYVTSRAGRFDSATARAVLAFRKVNRMARTHFASRSVYAKLFRGRGGFRLRHPEAGKHVELDWSRQVLALARAGRAERIYHASSGKSSTPTVLGTFRFYLRQRGYNARRMLHSNYFIGGYAVHGYHSVPTYPASHGCIRVPIPNAASIDAWVSLGDRIFVYR